MLKKILQFLGLDKINLPFAECCSTGAYITQAVGTGSGHQYDDGYEVDLPPHHGEEVATCLHLPPAPKRLLPPDCESSLLRLDSKLVASVIEQPG